MRAARLLLVLILLAGMTSTAQAQVLPRRRAGAAVGKGVAEFGAKFTMDALTHGMNKAFDELGDVLVLQLELQFFAQIEMMEPPAKKQFEGGKQQDPKQGCVCLLLAESAALAERLKEEEFSPPVLEKMYMQYAGIDSTKAAGKGSPWESRPIYLEPPKKGTSAKDLANRKSVTYVERHLPKDPRSKAPQSVHCSFVFRTTKDGEQFRKTVDFDLILDKQTKAEPTAACPWQLKNLQYDQLLPDEKVK